MDINQHKTEVKSRLVEAIARAVEEGKLTESQLPEIADFILENMAQAQDHPQIVALTLHLASRWPIFHNVALAEKGEEKKAIEEQTANQMIELIKSGNTTEALHLAKSVVQK